MYILKIKSEISINAKKSQNKIVYIEIWNEEKMQKYFKNNVMICLTIFQNNNLIFKFMKIVKLNNNNKPHLIAQIH